MPSFESLIETKKYLDNYVTQAMEGPFDEDTLNALSVDLEQKLPQKVDSLYWALEYLKKELEFWKSKRDEMNSVKKNIESNIDFLRKRTTRVMVENQIDGLIGNEYRVMVQDAKKALVIDEALLGDEFKRQVVTIEPYKELIREKLESGEPVLGAKLEEVKFIKFYKKRGV